MCCVLVIRIGVTVYFVVTKKKYTPFSHTKWAQPSRNKEVLQPFFTNKQKGIDSNEYRARFTGSLRSLVFFFFLVQVST